MSPSLSGRCLVVAVCILAVAGCTPDAATGPGGPSYLISDAVHSDGKPHFYFLPPMVANPAVSGTFDPALQPEVSICQWVADACATELVRLPATVSVTDEHYHANWHTTDYQLSATSTYRIRILVNETELGFADVDVVTSGRELRNVNTGEYIPLLDGRTLPVKFRIEQGFLARIEVMPLEATANIGATQQFVALLWDLHGNSLLSPAPHWASSDASIATVDQTGLATAVSDGETRISASAAGISGEATLTVVGGFLVADGGAFHSCALNQQGQAFCWGDNTWGQLGDGTTASARFLPTAVAGGHLFTTISASGNGHTCAIATDGRAYCWGLGSDGQRGDGSLSSISRTPGLVSGTQTWQSISTGHNHTCGVTTTSLLYCWGRNGNAQLGTGGFSPGLQPVPLLVAASGSGWATVSLGHDHSCALKATGQAFCWGLNHAGQAGDGSTSLNRFHPSPVATSLTLTSVQSGRFHVCAIATTGQVLCWGSNDSGQLGDGTTTLRRTPVLIAGLLSFTALGSGVSHTCGVTTSGAAYCWGSDSVGQLGNGTAASSAVPVAVLGGLVFESITAGQGHSCAITTSSQAYCWGFNSFGQLGDGTSTHRQVPTLVATP